ncbi:hypothetical protein P3H15_22845 [Rhodococcus sp. T2V]|uniref:hypothetical protein n=1 Tax=Rhodococcus sp. T2V TaxID=3034164 RepID=UPI0023E177AA|nr:hypothetical protein [Rhodococcus sp. T2V]MDF3307865.1 hypothetical protein [Rhodococcus sp. T2V]
MTEPIEPSESLAARAEELARESTLTARLEVLALLEAHVEGRNSDFDSLILAPNVSDAELFCEALALLAAVLLNTGTYGAVLDNTRSQTLAELGRA